MPLFTPKRLVSPEAERWIESSVDWLIEEFGTAPMAAQPLWVGEVFAGRTYGGNDDDVQRVLNLVCVRMGASVELIDLEIIEDESASELAGVVPLESKFDGEAGHYVKVGDRHQIAITRRQSKDPVGTVATLAHEVGHLLLLGEGRISSTRSDHEQLTDLATVFFGFGIFTANASHNFVRTQRGWTSSSLGYLGEKLLGYGLAYWAFKRGESKPEWSEFLDTNPRVYMNQGLRYLQARR